MISARLPASTIVRARLPADQPLPADARVAVHLRRPLLAFPREAAG